MRNPQQRQHCDFSTMWSCKPKLNHIDMSIVTKTLLTVKENMIWTELLLYASEVCAGLGTRVRLLVAV